MRRVLAVLLLAAGSAGGASLTSKVDPFIGTGGHGHTFPGPSLPFGMIQPGPDTRLTGWDGCSGYHHDDTRLYGFSHTHLSGTGASDYGDVLLMATTGEARLSNGADGTPGYSSRFSHAREVARPGYYAVTLDDSGVRAELTATKRAGLHRYAFPEGRPAHVVLDLTHRDEVIDSGVRVVSDREVAGWRRSRAWASDQRLFFVVRFSRPFVSRSLALDGRPDPSLAEARGRSVKGIFGFGDGGGRLLVKIGISAVDEAGARANLDAEIPGWDFDAVAKAADAAWEAELSKVRIEGATRQEERIFYTALYHAFLAPNLYVDVDGRYRGRDLEIHRAGFDYYTVFSLWDTFRALHPLLTILDTKRTANFVNTFIRQFDEGGRLPVWELSANETDCMIGYHAVSVIADAILKGIPGFDAERAYRAMVVSAEEDRLGLASYKRGGFVAADEEGESVSRTLEYAYDDWCLALVAKKLGKTAEADRYFRRAQAYLHVFDPASGFMRARVEGHWFSPFDPFEVNSHYTEGNAWQYAYSVPQDVAGLMRLHGGRAAFARRLDALFSAPTKLTGNDLPDVTGLLGQYAHGNEPSHHLAYLHAYAGEPAKSQALVRRLLKEMYADRPDGLIGNEDCGQMSAWYILSALGLYQVAPGSNEWVIGAPLFPKATLRLPNGRSFTIEADGLSNEKVFVGAARLNGKSWTRGFLPHEALAAGGVLTLTMTADPANGWATAEADLPRTSIDAPRVVPAPFVASGERVFRGTTRVSFACTEPGAEVRCTGDGSDPAPDSPRCEGPFALDGDAGFRVAAFARGERSPVVPVPFHRIPDGRSVALSAPYRPQYAAGGDDALIDGLRGTAGFRRGRWQGYLGTALTATVDLGAPREVRRVAMGFLQDAGSWILMPRSVRFSVSPDGTTWRAVGTATHDVPERERGTVIRDLGVSFPPGTVRWVRAEVTPFGPLPAWHPGSGEPSFFFADEIVFE